VSPGWGVLRVFCPRVARDGPASVTAAMPLQRWLHLAAELAASRPHIFGTLLTRPPSPPRPLRTPHGSLRSLEAATCVAWWTPPSRRPSGCRRRPPCPPTTPRCWRSWSAGSATWRGWRRTWMAHRRWGGAGERGNRGLGCYVCARVGGGT
jgi:hypothetical protein